MQLTHSFVLILLLPLQGALGETPPWYTKSSKPPYYPTTSISLMPTIEPTLPPPVDPTPIPTEEPTVVDPIPTTEEPTVEPTVIPTPIEPTDISSNSTLTIPTVAPTEEPVPTDIIPTDIPTGDPTVEPTVAPTTEEPIPTITPTLDPTAVPTVTLTPTDIPTTFETSTTSTSVPAPEPTLPPPARADTFTLQAIPDNRQPPLIGTDNFELSYYNGSLYIGNSNYYLESERFISLYPSNVGGSLTFVSYHSRTGESQTLFIYPGTTQPIGFTVPGFPNELPPRTANTDFIISNVDGRLRYKNTNRWHACPVTGEAGVYQVIYVGGRDRPPVACTAVALIAINYGSCSIPGRLASRF